MRIITLQIKGEYRKISDDIRAKIIADYQKGVPGHGARAVGKRFGVDGRSVLRIVKEAAANATQ
ncbi:MAG: hypothetical protein IJK81_11470 [Selenomonadaceae bacterium]|nr:hypothetical protein [Selenomonadaceae bacterium]